MSLIGRLPDFCPSIYASDSCTFKHSIQSALFLYQAKSDGKFFYAKLGTTKNRMEFSKQMKVKWLACNSPQGDLLFMENDSEATVWRLIPTFNRKLNQVSFIFETEEMYLNSESVMCTSFFYKGSIGR